MWIRNTVVLLFLMEMKKMTASDPWSMGNAEEGTLESAKWEELFNETVKVSNITNDIEKDLVEPEPLLPEWGGNCTETHWKQCAYNLTTYFGYYYQVKRNKKILKYTYINCREQPTLCLKNGWTVTRCQVLCMGKCNREMVSNYPGYVAKEGPCPVGIPNIKI